MLLEEQKDRRTEATHNEGQKEKSVTEGETKQVKRQIEKRKGVSRLFLVAGKDPEQKRERHRALCQRIPPTYARPGRISRLTALVKLLIDSASGLRAILLSVFHAVARTERSGARSKIDWRVLRFTPHNRDSG